jgi:hypothetical protein
MERERRAPDTSLVIPGRATYLAVASVALFFSAQGASFGDVGRTVTHVQHTFADAIAGPQFGDAAASMERFHQLSGTYDGAAISGRSITVRWATDTRFCIDGVRQSGAVEHMIGPNASVDPGPCPVVAF